MNTDLSVSIKIGLCCGIVLAIAIFTGTVVNYFHNRFERRLDALHETDKIFEHVNRVYNDYRDRFIPAALRNRLAIARSDGNSLRREAMTISSRSQLLTVKKEVAQVIERLQAQETEALTTLNPEIENRILNWQFIDCASNYESEKENYDQEFERELSLITKKRDREVEIITGKRDLEYARIARLREQLEALKK